MRMRVLVAAITIAGILLLTAADAAVAEVRYPEQGGILAPPGAGCSCDAGGNPTPGFTLVFAFVAATLWARGRRRS